MGLLHRCTALHGNATVIPEDPQFAIHQNLFYFPHVWGLYDQGQKLVTGSGFFRGPGAPEALGASYSRDFNCGSITDEAPEPCYYFLGHLPSHYGHFLLCAYSRLWAYAGRAGCGMKLLVYGDVSPPTLARSPFIAELLGTLGIGLHDLVAFDRPTRLRRVMVASPSFEETNFAHTTFVSMCRHAGELLAARLSPAPDLAPVYLAKYKLPSGIMKLANEEELASRLERRGIEVVFPEQLSLDGQIRMFLDRPNIAGLAGSALHTAAFAPRRRLAILDYGPVVLSNQVLIDRVGRHHALHLYSTAGFEELSDTGAFQRQGHLHDIATVADDFMKIMDPFMGIKPMDWSAASTTDDASAGRSVPNQAHGRPARQSSASVFSCGLTAAAAAAGGVSGFLTGGYQFCTESEDRPWWEVDLERPVPVHEVHLHNRLDAGARRASRFQLAASLDGTAWTELHVRLEWPPFGGADGRPFVWRTGAPVLARFVRISLLDRDYLHLDQVAVFSKLLPLPRASRAPLCLQTFAGHLVCCDDGGALTAHDPAEITSADRLLTLDAAPEAHGRRLFRPGPDQPPQARQRLIQAGPLAGCVLHLHPDPFTAALSRDGLYYGAVPGEAELRATKGTFDAWELFARLDRDQALALLPAHMRPRAPGTSLSMSNEGHR